VLFVLTLSLLILAVVVAVLAIPFEVIFKIHRYKELQSDVAVRWLFGVVKFSIPSSPHKQKQIDIPRESTTVKKATGKRGSARAIKNLLWNARFRYRLLRFVKDVFKTIHIASFYLRVRLGLDDPADTGRLWAFFGPLSVFLSSHSNSTVSLEPDFEKEIVYVDSSGAIRIVPLQVIFTILAFLFSPITISALWSMSKLNKR